MIDIRKKEVYTVISYQIGNFMILVGRNILERLKRQHPDVAKRIDAWALEVEALTWDSPHDVKKYYGSADFPGTSKAVFNIKGNKYRILATIDYQRHIVIIEKAGTHTQYTKWRIP